MRKREPKPPFGVERCTADHSCPGDHWFFDAHVQITTSRLAAINRWWLKWREWEKARKR